MDFLTCTLSRKTDEERECTSDEVHSIYRSVLSLFAGGGRSEERANEEAVEEDAEEDG